MGRLPARLARILTYAALACGGSVACLLLLSAPAQADDSGSGLSLLSGATSEDEGAVESVGRLLGDTTRAASDKTTDIVREVGAAVPVAEPVVQPVVDTTTEVVGHTTDAVATEVEHVTAQVDDQVGEVLRPPPSGPPPTEESPTEQPPAEDPPADSPSVEQPKGEPAPPDEDRTASGARDRDSRSDAPRRTDRDRAAASTPSLDIAPALVVPAALTAPLAIGAPADASVVGHDASALPDAGPAEAPASCDICATGSSGSTVEPPTLQALVGPGPLSPPGLTATGLGRARIGPAATFSCPDASPD